MDDREKAFRIAQRRIRVQSHHALWLSAVRYRSDPLDQKLVDRVLASAIEAIEWSIKHPEADHVSLDAFERRGTE